MIVIGGDDNYKNEDEEDREFISQWARRKISSQFREEFLNGSKSFVFSWNKKHREIHEKALEHFLSPSEKRQKFEYHPPQRKGATKPTPPSQGKSIHPQLRSHIIQNKKGNLRICPFMDKGIKVSNLEELAEQVSEAKGLGLKGL